KQQQCQAVQLHQPHRCNSSASRLTDYKRGKGGRSSFSGMVATVFGCSGFFGKYVVNRLGKMGCQVICPYRGDPYDVKELKLMGDLGQILFLPIHLEDEASLRKAMQYSNVVVNLIGKNNETRNFSFEDVNYLGAQRIARLAKESGVEKLLHFSSLNACPNPAGHVLPEGSEFLRTKFKGEMAVREEFPEAIVFRPADMFGQLDHFLTLYARPYRRVPDWAASPTYHCTRKVGPLSSSRYRLDHLITYIYQVLRYSPSNIRLTEFNRTLPFKLQMRLINFVRPVSPPYSLDRIEREFVTDTLTPGNPTLADLGVQLTPLEHRIHWEIKPYRLYNYYWASIGEFPEPDPPPLAH
uniref:NADH dehydrogenase [ubiquinone] 1 alpha subcomplex subunit 9, mitochondrial n=1 Tax=Macrostomum lignano TaxID=282301 RepID=A0A1I8G6T8_9PLAT